MIPIVVSGASQDTNIFGIKIVTEVYLQGKIQRNVVAKQFLSLLLFFAHLKNNQCLLGDKLLHLSKCYCEDKDINISHYYNVTVKQLYISEWIILQELRYTCIAANLLVRLML